MLTEQNVERIENLMISYFRAVDHVCKNHKLPKEEKLERLLDPLIGLNKLLAPLHSLNEYRRSWDGTYPFISECVEKDDLDLENLDYDRDKYGIDWCENDRPHRRGPRIWKYETEEERRIREEVMTQEAIRRQIEVTDFEPSLVIHEYPSDLYPEWLPALDEEKIQSKDLLDQILVCYTIKRAMNGDEKAINKLYSLYKDAAEGVGINFRHYNKEIATVDEVKNTSRVLLRFIIEGFSPEHILMNLLSDQKNLSIPGWVKDFFIYYLSQYLPPIIQDALTEIGLIQRDVQRNRFIFQYFRLLAILNPCAPIRDVTLWENSPVRSRRFNTYCFRPGIVKMGPRKNLTTWIFGRRNEIDTLTKAKREDDTIGRAWQPYGKLYQLIRDKYRPDIEKQKKKKNFAFGDLDIEEGNLNIQDQAAAARDNRPSVEDEIMDNEKDQETINRVIKRLSMAPIPSRNTEIFIQWFFEGIIQTELAERYNLSTRQIKRICRECKDILRSSRKTLLSSPE